jgi:UDP-N-acetyl-D-glucosamine dehydrogenase
MPFHPGAGVGGHCIPVDPAYLASKAREIGAPTRFIDLANELNHSLPSYFVGVATDKLGGLTGRRILVVGVAYKPDVSDVRETPVSGLISQLRSKGAHVFWHDDLVQEWNGENSAPLNSDYDLIILANPHNGIDLSLLNPARILDTRGGY